MDVFCSTAINKLHATTSLHGKWTPDREEKILNLQSNGFICKRDTTKYYGVNFETHNVIAVHAMCYVALASCMAQ